MKPNAFRGLAVMAFCTLLNTLDGYDILAVAFNANSISHDFGLSNFELGAVLSAALVGTTVASPLAGAFAVRFGTRAALLVSIACTSIGMFISVLSSTTAVFATGRVIAGLGVGGVLITCSAIVASVFTQSGSRGFAMSIFSTGFGIGGILAGAVARAPGITWQQFFLLGATFGLISFLLCLVFDFSSQRTQAAAPKRPTFRRSFMALTSASWSFWPLVFGNLFLFYVAFSWTPKIMTPLGVDVGIAAGSALSFGSIAGAILHGLIIYFGPKFSTLRAFSSFSLLVVAICFVLLAIFSNFHFSLVIFWVLGAALGSSITSVYTLLPHVFGIEGVALGGGIALGIGRVGGMLGPVSAGALLGAGLAVNALFVIMAIFVLVLMVLLGMVRSALEYNSANDSGRNEACCKEGGL